MESKDHLITLLYVKLRLGAKTTLGKVYNDSYYAMPLRRYSKFEDDLYNGRISPFLTFDHRYMDNYILKDIVAYLDKLRPEDTATWFYGRSGFYFVGDIDTSPHNFSYGKTLIRYEDIPIIKQEVKSILHGKITLFSDIYTAFDGGSVQNTNYYNRVILLSTTNQYVLVELSVDLTEGQDMYFCFSKDFSKLWNFGCSKQGRDIILRSNGYIEPIKVVVEDD